MESEPITRLGRVIMENLDPRARFLCIHGYKSQPAHKWAAQVGAKKRVAAVIDAIRDKRAGAADPTRHLNDFAKDKDRELAYNEYSQFACLLPVCPAGDDALATWVSNGVVGTGAVLDVVLCHHVDYGAAKKADMARLDMLNATTLDNLLNRQISDAATNLRVSEDVIRGATKILDRGKDQGLNITREDLREAVLHEIALETGERERANSVQARDLHTEPLLGLGGDPIKGVQLNKTKGEVNVWGFHVSTKVRHGANITTAQSRFQNEITCARSVIRALRSTERFRRYVLTEDRFDKLSTENVVVDSKHFPGSHFHGL